MLERAQLGTPTSISKVKAHEGVQGNEHADKLAKAAATGEEPPQLHMDIDNRAYHGQYRPQTCDPSTGRARQTSDLTKDVADRIPDRREETKGTYNNIWRNVWQHIWHALVPYIHSTEITHAARKTIYSYRLGTIYNAKIARRIKRPYWAKQHKRPQPGVIAPCPLCGQEDSGGHIMGSCEHPHLRGLVILRHNDAVRTLARALSLSTHLGDGLLCMDAGKEGTDTLGTRIPPWILPKVKEAVRDGMRPDILFMQNAPDVYAKRTMPLEDKTGVTLHLIELGYGPDTRYEEKRAAKQLQHKALVAALTDEGWTVQVHTIIIGNGGTVFVDLQQFLRDTLKLTKQNQQKIARKIIRITVERAHQLLKTRRWLERAGPASTSGHPTGGCHKHGKTGKGKGG
jgi:hypothetical protein